MTRQVPDAIRLRNEQNKLVSAKLPKLRVAAPPRTQFHDYLDEHPYECLTKEQIEAARAAERRRYTVDGPDSAKWPVTSRDKRNIRNGTLIETRSLTTAKRWYVAPEWYVAGDGQERGSVFLVLMGGKGIGKTVAGCWLLAEHGGRYVRSSELIRMANSFYEQDKAEYRYLVDARFVLLDEIGAEALTDQGAAILDEFINARQCSRKTMLTCNMDPEGTGKTRRELLAERIGERAIQRIEQAGAIREVDGPNLRLPPPRVA